MIRSYPYPLPVSFVTRGQSHWKDYPLAFYNDTGTPSTDALVPVAPHPFLPETGNRVWYQLTTSAVQLMVLLSPAPCLTERRLSAAVLLPVTHISAVGSQGLIGVRSYLPVCCNPTRQLNTPLHSSVQPEQRSGWTRNVKRPRLTTT